MRSAFCTNVALDSGDFPACGERGEFVGHAGFWWFGWGLFGALRGLRWSHQGLHREGNASGFQVDLEDFDLNDLTGFDGLRRLLDKAVGELADVDQTVLVDANIHEGPKLGDVGDDALKDHAGLNVGKLADVLGEIGGDELVARIATGLAQLFEDVRDGEGPGGELLCVDFGEELRALDEFGDGGVEGSGNLLDDRVRLGMDGGAVERVLAVADAKEAGGLLEGFGADAGDLVELRAGAKFSMRIAIGDDVERGAFGDAGNVTEQGPGGGVEVDADAIDATFDDGLKGLLELTLIDVVLVLADTDGFGIDLDEFGERVLETTGDRDGAADGEVEVRELLAGDVGCGVNAGTGLGDGDGEEFVEACGREGSRERRHRFRARRCRCR